MVLPQVQLHLAMVVVHPGIAGPARDGHHPHQEVRMQLREKNGLYQVMTLRLTVSKIKPLN